MPPLQAYSTAEWTLRSKEALKHFTINIITNESRSPSPPDPNYNTVFYVVLISLHIEEMYRHTMTTILNTLTSFT